MNQERLLKVLLTPYHSEKASNSTDMHNYYVFRVVKDAKKPEIKQAVEMLFDVEVEAVRSVNVKGKIKRTAKGKGRTSDWKKVYVKLETGHEINLMDSD